MKKLHHFFNRFGDLIRYILVGGITTLISIASFALFSGPLGIHYTIGNVLSWILSVAFSFWASKWFVFQSTSTQKETVLKEAAGFFAARLTTLAAEELLMLLLISALGASEMAAKVFCNVAVIVLNYVLSKFLVFRRKR